MTRGRLTLLKSASPDGYVFASNRDRINLANKLVQEGLLKHHYGLIYELTQRGYAALEPKTYG